MEHKTKLNYFFIGAATVGLAAAATAIAYYLSKLKKQQSHYLFPFMLRSEFEFLENSIRLYHEFDQILGQPIEIKKKYLKTLFPPVKQAKEIINKFFLKGVQYWKKREESNTTRHDAFIFVFGELCKYLSAFECYESYQRQIFLDFVNKFDITFENFETKMEDELIKKSILDTLLQIMKQKDEAKKVYMSKFPESEFIQKRIEFSPQRCPMHDDLMYINRISITAMVQQKDNKRIEEILADVENYIKLEAEIKEQISIYRQINKQLVTVMSFLTEVLYFRLLGYRFEQIYFNCHALINDKKQLDTLNSDQLNLLLKFYLYYRI